MWRQLWNLVMSRDWKNLENLARNERSMKGKFDKGSKEEKSYRNTGELFRD
jgi:hypothetical protein